MADELKVAVTVAEMARMLRLSRSRLYQLIGTAFPEPSRDDRGRPYYDAEQQAICLEVRRRNFVPPSAFQMSTCWPFLT